MTLSGWCGLRGRPDCARCRVADCECEGCQERLVLSHIRAFERVDFGAVSGPAQRELPGPGTDYKGVDPMASLPPRATVREETG